MLLTGLDGVDAVGAGTGRPVHIVARQAIRWAIEANRVVLNDGVTTRVFDLDPAGAKEVFSSPFADARIRFYCLSADGSVLVEGFQRDADFEMRATDLVKGRRLGDVSVSADESSIAAFATSSKTSRQRSSCDSNGILLRGSGGDGLSWQYVDRSVARIAADDGDPAGVAAGDPAIATARLEWTNQVATLVSAGGKVLARVRSPRELIGDALFLRDRGIIAIGYESGRLELWDVTAMTTPMVSLAPYKSPIAALDYDSQRGLLLSADADGTVNAWPLPDVRHLLALTSQP